MTGFKPSGYLRFDRNVVESWRCWSEGIDWYLEAAGLKSPSNSRKVAILLNCAGPDDVDVYENLPFEWAVASKIFKTVKEAFATYCNQRKNLVHERFKFWEFAESEGQSFESYFNKLRIMAKACKFAETDNMIRDKIIFFPCTTSP